MLGAGHIALPVCEFAAKSGFEVYVCDDRPSFANEGRFPDAAQVLCDSFENCIRQLKITSYDYIVIITRGHTHDADCLRERHHASIDEADDHDGRGRGRLDHGGDARAEQDALERGAREFIEYDLELVAGHFLQPVAHERHAEQEQGHAAKQRDHIVDPQNASRSLCDIFALTSHYSRKRCKDKCRNCTCV